MKPKPGNWVITRISCLCCHLTQCNWTVWEQNQGRAQEPPLTSARTPKSCTAPSKLQQHHPAAPAGLCPEQQCLGGVPPVLTPGWPSRGGRNSSNIQHLPWTPSPESSCLHTWCYPQSRAHLLHLRPMLTHAHDFYQLFSVCVFCLFAWFIWFVCLFPHRRDSRHCSALGDEKKTDLAPYSKLHLWKEITKQCISCAFLSVSEFNRKMARS